MKEEEFYEKTLTRDIIFKGNVIKVAVDKVELADGSLASRELVFHKGAVGIIALTEDDKIILVKQFRKPVERTLVEIPAGKIEKLEKNPLLTAQRELEEETGFGAKQMTLIYDFILSPGFSNERLFLYLAQDLYRIEQPKAQDDDERIELIYATLEEAKAMIGTEISDSKTIMALQYWELMMLKQGGREFGRT